MRSYRFAPAVCFCHSVVCDDIWLSLWIWSRNGILVFLHLCIINMNLSTSSHLTKNLSIFFHRKWCRYSLKFQWSVKLDAGKKPQTSFLPSFLPWFYFIKNFGGFAGIFVLCCSLLHCSRFPTADNTDTTAHGFLWNTLVVMSRPEWPVFLWSRPKGRQARDGTESLTKSEPFILGWCQKQRTRLNVLGAAKLLW